MFLFVICQVMFQGCQLVFVCAGVHTQGDI